MNRNIFSNYATLDELATLNKIKLKPSTNAQKKASALRLEFHSPNARSNSVKNCLRLYYYLSRQDIYLFRKISIPAKS
jgi:hypothetical protein